MNKWIRVEDRLPDDGAIVIVAYGGRVPRWTSQAVYYKDSKRFVADCGDVTPSHWMWFPNPPDERDIEHDAFSDEPPMSITITVRIA